MQSFRESPHAAEGGALGGGGDARPLGGNGGERPESPVRVVGWAGPVHLPAEGAGRIHRVILAHPPPVLPECLEVVLRFPGCLAVEIRGEESGEAEQDGLAGAVGAHGAEGPPRDALGEQVHGQLVGSVSEGAGQRLRVW